MIQVRGGPPSRLRSRVRRKAGRPGARASSGVEAAAATDHRVSAALGWGAAPARVSSTAAPPLAAAMARRRLAVRVRALASPQALRITAPTPGLRAASSPTASRVWMSRARTSSRASGCSPSSFRPRPSGWPVSWAMRSCRPQTRGRPPAAVSARPRAKALAEGASAAVWAKRSCSRPGATARDAASPGRPRARAAGSSRASWARRAAICSSLRMFFICSICRPVGGGSQARPSAF
ncbi:hypothetical protein D3C80_1102580 [compost metagenome]